MARNEYCPLQASTCQNPRINFIHRDAKRWHNILLGKDLEAELSSVRDGRDAWIISTYAALKGIGWNVILTDNFVDQELCVCHFDEMRGRRYPKNSFLIIIRADRPRSFLCNYEIVQSPAVVESKKCIYIPHWPQPNLHPRDPQRACRLERIGYFGLHKNLAADCKKEPFKSALKELNVELAVIDQPEDWNDYQNIDLVIALRDGTEEFLASKPATKLFNAWLAGCPIIVGREPAYRLYQQNEYDLIEVASAIEAINAIKRLKSSPSTYEKMLEQARTRSKEVSREATTREWINFFEAYAFPAYSRWKRKPNFHRTVDFLFGALAAKCRVFLRGRFYYRGYDSQGNRLPPPHAVRRLLRWLEQRTFGLLDK